MESGEPHSEKKLVQQRLRKSNRVRRTIETFNSLSTITEEPKSNRTTPTVRSKSTYTKGAHGDSMSSLEERPSGSDSRVSFTLPPLVTPSATRKKRHTSVVLKGTSREIVVAHVDTPERSRSVQENLLFRLQTSKKPLFPTVLKEQESPSAPSILVTGFGLRNLSSLQNALQDEEYQKLKELYCAQTMQDDSSTSISGKSSDSQRSHASSSFSSKNASSIETQTPPNTEDSKQDRMKYLMGLDDGEEEASYRELEGLSLGSQDQEDFKGTTEAMRCAQKYLRVHKVFEFFQFIAAHLLGALPENPIEFMLILLDRCLLYRSGLIQPPVLYGPKHLEALFNLLDKMRTGYIDYEQYKTGMRTLGICSFNDRPHTTSDGMIAKDDFIDAAHESLVHLLDDMIRRHYLQTIPPMVPAPPPTPQFSSSQSCCSAECRSFAKTGLFLDCTFHT